MNKYQLLFVVFFASSTSFGQPVKINFELPEQQSTGIIQVNNLKKDDIFLKVKEWITLNYKSAKDAVQLAESSKIILKGKFSTNDTISEGTSIDHTLVLDFKDGKFRYSYSDFIFTDNDSRMAVVESALSFKDFIILVARDNILSSVADIKKHLLDNSKKSDW